jgi:hypothetical protein
MTYRRSLTTTGTFANRPTSAPDGSIYLCTDGPLQFIRSGGAWNPYLGSMPLNTPPAASTWSLINATLNTNFSDSVGGLLFSGTVATGSALVAKKTAPATPYSITTHMLINWGGTGSNASSWNFCYAGICWRETSTGNLHVFAPCHATTAAGTYVNTYRLLTASGTGSSGITYGNSTDFNITQLTSNLQNNGIWLKATDDGVNRIVYYSGDGVNFTQFHSITRTTSVTPDEIGIIAGNYVTSGQSVVPNTFFTSVKIA